MKVWIELTYQINLCLQQYSTPAQPESRTATKNLLINNFLKKYDVSKYLLLSFLHWFPSSTERSCENSVFLLEKLKIIIYESMNRTYIPNKLVLTAVLHSGTAGVQNSNKKWLMIPWAALVCLSYFNFTTHQM